MAMGLPVSIAASLMLYVALSFSPQQVAGDGKIQVRLVRYDNPSGKGSNGHCCDGRHFICQPRGCDHYFEMCLDSFYGSDSISSCSIGRHTTGSTQNEDNIQFSSMIGNTANPFEISFTQWNNGVKVKVHVWDEDGPTRDDFVDSLQSSIMVAAAGSETTAHWTSFIMRARTSLTGELRVFCTSHYYGPACYVYCRPTYQFDCDSNGQKVCRSGWTGSDCTSVDACSSSPCQNGAQCQTEGDAYVCLCHSWFTGRNCETNVSACDSDICQNGGQCHMLRNDTGYYCKCPEEWTGDHCETKLENCPLKCLHQGECTVKDGEFICRCQSGWEGEDCGVRSYNFCQPDTCFNKATCVDNETGFTCICSHQFTGERCDVAIDKGFTSDNATSDVINTDDSVEPNDGERLFVFDGNLQPDDAQHLVVAISNLTNFQLQQLDCDHMIYVDYRLEYCTGKSGNDVTLFFFDVTCNSTRLSWSAVEELFDSMSSEEFHRMLPLKLSEDSDCVPGTRAFSSALKSTTTTTWLVPIVCGLVLVVLIALVTFFIVRRYRRRQLSMTPVSYEQPLYNDLHLDLNDGRVVTTAPRVPNVYLMCQDDESQPAAEAGSRRVDDWLHTYDNMSTR